MGIINKKTAVSISLLLLIVLAWQIWLAKGISFFWEDFDIFHIYWSQQTQDRIFKDAYAHNDQHLSKLSLYSGMLTESLKQLFSSKRLFQIGFSPYGYEDRPYQFILWDFLKSLFGKNVIFYRLFKTIIVSVSALFAFLLVKRASFLFAVLCLLLYLTSSEVWLSSLYISHIGPIAQCATLISVFLFIKLKDKKDINFKVSLFYYLAIILISNCAVLLTGDARYLAFIFIFYIIRFKPIKEWKYHIPILAILLCLELPILGFIKKMLFDKSFIPINIASHTGTSKSTISSMLTAISNRKFAIDAIGGYVLLLLVVFLIMYFTPKLFRLSNKELNQEQKSKSFEDVFIFSLWFLCTLFMAARVRSFRYGSTPFSFQIYDLAYFILPFLLFLMHFIKGAADTIKNKVFKTIILVLCILVFSFQVFCNFNRLLLFRKIAVDNFIPWQETLKHIESESDNALVLAFTKMHYLPFVTQKKGIKILNTKEQSQEKQFSDISFIENDLKEYKDVYVASKKRITFLKNNEPLIIKEQIVINGKCDKTCGYLKTATLNEYEPEIYLYRFSSTQNLN